MIMAENGYSYCNAVGTKARLRVCCLYRVSTLKQVDHDINNQADIPVQRKACHDFAERMGWEIVMEEQENGISGFKVSANNRDKIQLIKERAEEGRFDILLVFMFDRIGRRAEETPFVVEWFVKNGIQVWSVNEGEQKIESHVDRLTNYIRYWQADGESQKTSMRTKAALGQMVQEGRFRGGIPPYGYKLVPSGIINKHRHEVNKLEIDDEEAKVVRMIFDMCVSSGFGRFKIANTLTKIGIPSRTGGNWHEATVGHILHNVTYKGILRSGKTYSEIFPQLQIISPETFDLAQKLMEERSKDCNALRTMPLNTRGKSLLSGNVFCGHCGSRLTLTTSGTVRQYADGTKVGIKRIRYVCYSKTRKRVNCTGQTGYTMHILDKMITEILHQVFDKITTPTADELVARADRRAMQELNNQLSLAKTKQERAMEAYESLKAEIVRSVQGKSVYSPELLAELVEVARIRTLEADSLVAQLTRELKESNQRIQAILVDYRNLKHWSEIFDSSEMAVKKMIAGYIIKRLDVYAGYRLHVEFNMNFAQFDLRVDIPSE